MIEEGQLPAWIALFFGLYSFSAGIGELRQPGFWLRMVRELEASRGLRFLTGVICIAIGAIVYLANPWAPGDWLAILVTVIGGGMIIEGMVFLAFGDRFAAFSRRLLSGNSFVIALFGMIFGLALVAVAAIRI